jgi:hypothetical protein
MVSTPNFISYMQALIIILLTAVIGLTAYPLTCGNGDRGNGFLDFAVSYLSIPSFHLPLPLALLLPINLPGFTLIEAHFSRRQ